MRMLAATITSVLAGAAIAIACGLYVAQLLDQGAALFAHLPRLP